ncbi:hypothetical protein G6514_004804 [Epicoccum nigrum]|nr:hypothetical protein G6514_004804 [Epicoccum nigrum]
MAKTLIGALALASQALAFSNTSPFFLFSTADLLLESSGASIASAASVAADVLQALKECPTKNYVVVEQDWVSAADYADGRSTPRLAHYMSGQQPEVKSIVSVPDVVGLVDSKIIKYLEDNCGTVKNIKLDGPPIASAMRSLYMGQQDQFLDDSMAKFVEAKDYTVVYLTTPLTEHGAKAQLEAQQQQQQYQYESDTLFDNNMQMELKRDTTAHTRRANSTAEGGLFERYQYFTPGLFMGFAAVIPLFLILLVGIRALLSLEVSYFAFSKEMGPNAQKKQQ